ncbi:MAG: Unknown protein [uncultured Sulfurovum sp.]|uniref:LysM domain-containing protein n=1 Tax=uncultured Sulfurovum sp. TaxID=269237 RepID=A0A6S6UHP9_9BACT|nr:MAG: Unknown protein [uncultured Sulfurovum sp.]
MDDSYYENYKKSLENKGDFAESSNSEPSSNRFLMPLGLVALGVAGYLGYTMYPTPSTTPFKDQNTEQKMFVESIQVEKKALEKLSEKVVTRDTNEVLETSVTENKDITPVNVSRGKENREPKSAKVLANSSKLNKAEEKETNAKNINEKKKQLVSHISKESEPTLEKRDETKVASVNQIEKNVLQEKTSKQKVIEKESLAELKTVEQSKLHNIKQDDKELLGYLSQSSVDSVKPSTVKSEVASKTQKSTKKRQQKKNVDTYNKVVLVKNSAGDELSKLSQLMSDVVKAPKDNTSDKNKESLNTYTSAIRKEVATRVNEMRIIIVKQGDTLGSLALKAYGNVMHYPKIFAANPDILEDPNKLSIGQRIRIPRDMAKKEEDTKSETTS